jgi:hypothetical protein
VKAIARSTSDSSSCAPGSITGLGAGSSLLASGTACAAVRLRSRNRRWPFGIGEPRGLRLSWTGSFGYGKIAMIIIFDLSTNCRTIGHGLVDEVEALGRALLLGDMGLLFN